ncbi:MAG: methenyltetrahydromethanopterin cyclohydrolase [Planctomycetaceae bacterium]
MNLELNRRTVEIVRTIAARADELGVSARQLPGGAHVLDFGVESEGGPEAGLLLARVCMAGLAEITLAPSDFAGFPWPHVTVSTSNPVSACLLSQYAGWQISVGKFFAMGSGPMRAAAAREELFEKLDYREKASEVVGVLETSRLPGEAVVEFIAERTEVPADRIHLLAAPTSSQAGNIQVVARSIETALHKLFELGFDLKCIASGWGTAPLPPVAADDMAGIGRTNDAILYGGNVTLWVHGDDDSISRIGPQVPASSSAAHGKPFIEIFEDAGKDFYKIDPHLFSPGRITFHNLDTGRTQVFGKLEPDVLRKSFGLG